MLVNNININDEIINTYFSCDLSICKGACCTFEGEYGAPLEPNEIIIIRNCLEVIKKYLPSISIETIEKDNFYQGKFPNFTTTCINKKDCVFVFYENDVALCAFERAFLNKEINFRKPLSCHLFPIRESNFYKNTLYLSKINECQPAFIKGSKNKIPLLNEVKEALIRKYGTKWWEKLESQISNRNL